MAKAGARALAAPRPLRHGFPFFRYVGYIVAQAWIGFWRHPAMSVASTFTVAGMLLLSSFFVILQRGLDVSIVYLESKVEFYVELEDVAKPSDILTLKTRLEADPAVARVDFVSKDEALKRLKDVVSKSGSISIEDVATNPLPASLEVKMREADDTGRIATTMRDEVGKGVVSDVVENPAVVEKLLAITQVLSLGGLAVLALMLFVTLFVIVNTIRIAVHARRSEIEIMKLVGATDWFVRWPFILEGMLVGLLGAALAFGALAAAAPTVVGAMTEFIRIVPVELGPAFVAQLAAGVLGSALLVGAAGAFISVRAHLR